MDKCAKRKYADGHVKRVAIEHDDQVCPCPPLKVVLLGNSGVGKTSILRGYSDVPPPATIGASFLTCDVAGKGEKITLQVWDTAGQERFRCMVPMYMRNSAAAIIVFDITNRQSFEDIDKWAKELDRCCGSSEPTIILVGNKKDLESKRMVKKEEAIKKAKFLNGIYHEVSAKDVKFEEILHDLVSHVSSPPPPPPPTVLLSTPPSTSSSSSCCPLL